MDELKNEQNRICNISGKVKGALDGAAIALYTTLLTAAPAFAEGDIADTVTTPVTEALSSVYSIMLKIALPIAVIVIAVCAIKIIWGDSKSAEQGKSLAVKVIIGFALLYLAPMLVKQVSQMFGANATSDLSSYFG